MDDKTAFRVFMAAVGTLAAIGAGILFGRGNWLGGGVAVLLVIFCICGAYFTQN